MDNIAVGLQLASVLKLYLNQIIVEHNEPFALSRYMDVICNHKKSNAVPFKQMSHVPSVIFGFVGTHIIQTSSICVYYTIFSYKQETLNCVWLLPLMIF